MHTLALLLIIKKIFVFFVTIVDATDAKLVNVALRKQRYRHHQ